MKREDTRYLFFCNCAHTSIVLSLYHNPLLPLERLCRVSYLSNAPALCSDGREEKPPRRRREFASHFSF